jgi:hypothetical protein
MLGSATVTTRLSSTTMNRPRETRTSVHIRLRESDMRISSTVVEVVTAKNVADQLSSYY